MSNLFDLSRSILVCQNEWQILAHNISTAGSAQVSGRGPNRPKNVTDFCQCWHFRYHFD